MASCPFKLLLPSKRAASLGGQDSLPAEKVASKCPFSSLLTSAQAPVDAASSVPNEAELKASLGPQQTTPQASKTTPETTLTGAEQDTCSAPATCPYGFSSAASLGPKLSPLHCSLCRSLLHCTAALQPCGHKFCRFCVSPFQDCPVCGCDVEGMQDDIETQGERCMGSPMLHLHGVANVSSAWGRQRLICMPHLAPSSSCFLAFLHGTAPCASLETCSYDTHSFCTQLIFACGTLYVQCIHIHQCTACSQRSFTPCCRLFFVCHRRAGGCISGSPWKKPKADCPGNFVCCWPDSSRTGVEERGSIILVCEKMMLAFVGEV